MLVLHFQTVDRHEVGYELIGNNSTWKKLYLEKLEFDCIFYYDRDINDSKWRFYYKETKQVVENTPSFYFKTNANRWLKEHGKRVSDKIREKIFEESFLINE